MQSLNLTTKTTFSKNKKARGESKGLFGPKLCKAKKLLFSLGFFDLGLFYLGINVLIPRKTVVDGDTEAFCGIRVFNWCVANFQIEVSFGGFSFVGN